MVNKIDLYRDREPENPRDRHISLNISSKAMKKLTRQCGSFRDPIDSFQKCQAFMSEALLDLAAEHQDEVPNYQEMDLVELAEKLTGAVKLNLARTVSYAIVKYADKKK